MKTYITHVAPPVTLDYLRCFIRPLKRYISHMAPSVLSGYVFWKLTEKLCYPCGSTCNIRLFVRFWVSVKKNYITHVATPVTSDYTVNKYQKNDITPVAPPLSFAYM